MKTFLKVLGLLCMPQLLTAQTFFSAKNYPNHSFMKPLGIPFAFVGNFGETRPDHFHSGLDIRTGGKENLPVYAVEDGYISRVKIEAKGFGNALYITHANGYTTVYAHLNRFYPELESFVRRKQYQQKSWVYDQTFFPDQFWVRKGTLIAWSGNTGSSQGPHLHFEVRNAKTDAPLNPLLFFNEISDKQSPVIHQLSVYDGNKSVYEQTPAIFQVMKGRLKNDTINIPYANVFLGFHADDYMPMGAGTLGVYEMNLYVDDQPLIGWQLDNISYDLTRYVNALTDYKTRKNKGITLQLCRKLPNNGLPVFKTFDSGNGIIHLLDGESRRVELSVYDTRNNLSVLSFVIRCRLKPGASSCEQMMKAGKKNSFRSDLISCTLDEAALYDDICFQSKVTPGSHAYSYRYQVHRSDVPVHTVFELALQPKATIANEYRDKLAIVWRNGNTIAKAYPAIMQGQWVKAMVNEFGVFEIVIDQQAPVINSRLKDGMIITTSKSLAFTIKEETTSVKSCTASVDGQWLRLAQKGTTWTYELDEYFPVGTHKLQISASDENGNTQTKTYTLTR